MCNWNIFQRYYSSVALVGCTLHWSSMSKVTFEITKLELVRGGGKGLRHKRQTAVWLCNNFQFTRWNRLATQSAWMQNKPSTASDTETGQKGKKAYIRGKDSLKIRKKKIKPLLK